MKRKVLCYSSIALGLLLLFFAITPSPSESFQATVNTQRPINKKERKSPLLYLSSLSPEDAFDLERFQRRQQQLQLERQQHRRLPPCPQLGPQQVVQGILEELQATPWYYDADLLKPRPHPGVWTLWKASTTEWQQTMAAMVGAAASSNATSSSSAATSITTATAEKRSTVETVCALGRFLARPQQQFAILLGNDLNQNYASFSVDFPTDVIEWSDDEAWLECRLRCSRTDELWVVLGWTLHRCAVLEAEDTTDSGGSSSRNNSNKSMDTEEERAWYIHSFDWQDFRSEYRPGIGREEWERICG